MKEINFINAQFELYVTIYYAYDYFMETKNKPKSKALICMPVGELTIIHRSTGSKVKFISGEACLFSFDKPIPDSHMSVLSDFLKVSGIRRRLRDGRWMFVTSLRAPSREPLALSGWRVENDYTQKNLELFRKSCLVKFCIPEFFAVQRICQKTLKKSFLELSVEIKDLPVMITLDKYPYISSKDLWEALDKAGGPAEKKLAVEKPLPKIIRCHNIDRSSSKSKSRSSSKSKSRSSSRRSSSSRKS